MGKVFNFTFIAIGMMILLGAAGIATSAGYVLGIMGLTSPSALAGFQSSAFYTYYITIFGIVVTLSAVTIGIYGRQSALDGISAGIATAVLVLFIGDFISIVNYANVQASWAGWAIFLLLAPFIAGYVFALWEWIRGRD